MAHVTGGTVSYGETRKIGEYENKKSEVVLHFANPAGEAVTDAELEGFGAQAQAHVHTRLGVTPPAAAKPVGRPKNTDKDKLEDAIKAASVPTSAAPAASQPQAAAPLPAAVPPPAATAASPSADLTDLSGASDVLTGAPSPVTDRELTEKIMAKNSAGKGTLTHSIRELIGKYAGVGKASHDVPQEKRAAFLAELDALKAPS